MPYAVPRKIGDMPVRVPMSRLERFFHIATMITQFGAVVPVALYLAGTPDADTEVGDSSPVNTTIMAVILVVSVVLAIRYRDNIIRALPGMTPVLAFLLLALLSATWSDFPDITVRRTGTAITTALWGAYLASRFSLRDIVILIAQSLGIIAILSFIAAVAIPDLGINEVLQSDPGGVPGWKGLLSDKNTLGIDMATAAATMLYLCLSPGCTRRQKILWAAGMLLSLAELYLSQSRTSWFAGFVGIVACFVVRSMYRRPAVGLLALSWVLLLGVPAFFLIVRDLSLLTSLVGKDATLTGRVDLWQLVLPYGDRRPFLGYGYGAFWIADSPMTQEIWRILNSYQPPHAHNGWIETYLELGLVGCSVVGLQIAQMIVNTARASNLGRDVDAPYMMLIIVMMLLFNMTEADLIRAPALFWPFLIIGPVAISKVLRTKPRQMPARENVRVHSAVGPPPFSVPLNLAAPPPLKRPPYPPLRPSPQTGR